MNYAETDRFDVDRPSPEVLHLSLAYADDSPEYLASIGLAALALETNYEATDEESELYRSIWEEALERFDDYKARQQG